MRRTKLTKALAQLRVLINENFTGKYGAERSERFGQLKICVLGGQMIDESGMEMKRN